MATSKNTAPTAPDADLFDDATGSDFVRPEDVDGRALVVYVLEVGTDKGENGNEYDWVQVDAIALDGEATEKITPGEPFEMRFTSSQIVGQLKRKVGTGKPTLGRVDSRTSRFRTKAYGFNPIPLEETETRARAATAVQRYNESRHAADPFSA